MKSFVLSFFFLFFYIFIFFDMFSRVYPSVRLTFSNSLIDLMECSCGS